MELVAKKPDAHLACYGLKWCRCDVIPLGTVCKPCRNRREADYRARRPKHLKLLHRRHHNDYVRERLADPVMRKIRNEQARRWDASQRRKGTPYYDKAKALKRVKYWSGKLASLLSAAAA
jgi:hypothetical protein